MSNPHGIFVKFYMDAVEIKFESEKHGRPIFKDVPHIQKLIPGDQTTVIEKVAKPEDMRQFPREWEAFKRQNETGVTGTPLEQWPQITRSQVKEAKYFEIHTVEQLSEVSEVSCQKLGMGFFELRNKARAYLEAAAGTASATAQEAENQRLRDEMQALKAQIASLAESAPRRGRPPKSEEKSEDKTEKEFFE